MSDKRSGKEWIKSLPGVYVRTRKRDGVRVFYFRAWVPSEKRFRFFRLGTTLGQARNKRREILGDPEKAVRRREDRRSATLTMDELIDSFLKKYRSRGGTRYYAHVAESWKEHFGKALVVQVDRASVEDYRDQLQKDLYSDSTVRKYVSALGTLFVWAVGRHLVGENPVKGVKRPAEPDRNISYLTPDQEQAVLMAASPWVRPVISWAIGTGMRLGEILGLRWRDVDRPQGLVKLEGDRTKTGKARVIPLNPLLEGILQEAGRVENRESDAVFLDPRGQPLDKWALYAAVEAAFVGAEVPLVRGTTFNLFRHTYGTRLARMGVPFIKIAQLMGNSPRIIEKHYAAYAPDSDLRAVMERLAGEARSAAGKEAIA